MSPHPLTSQPTRASNFRVTGAYVYNANDDTFIVEGLPPICFCTDDFSVFMAESKEVSESLTGRAI